MSDSLRDFLDDACAAFCCMAGISTVGPFRYELAQLSGETVVVVPDNARPILARAWARLQKYDLGELERQIRLPRYSMPPGEWLTYVCNCVEYGNRLATAIVTPGGSEPFRADNASILQSLCSEALRVEFEHVSGRLRESVDPESESEQSASPDHQEPSPEPNHPPCVARATESYEWVSRERPDLTTQRSMHTFLRENGCPAYEDADGNDLKVPAFNTWNRYVRQGTSSGKPTSEPRVGRPHGSSVVRHDQV